MERPSHIIFDTQSRNFAHRLPLIGLALSLQAAAVWLFVHGLAVGKIHLPPGIIEVVRLPEKQPPSMPPPEPPIPTRIEVPQVPQPAVDVDTGQSRNTIVATTTAPATNPPPMPAGPDRAPVSITATHTAPPYPPIARRIGVEGKVTLRLTVTADGHVAQADIVTSSGRQDLDQTAQTWIVAHWTYKPALANGVPAAGHTLATVVFSLINEH